MRSFDLTITTEFDMLDFIELESIEELPTLPLKTFSQQEFEKRVQDLRAEYDKNKSIGIFF